MQTENANAIFLTLKPRYKKTKTKQLLHLKCADWSINLQQQKNHLSIYDHLTTGLIIGQ